MKILIDIKHPAQLNLFKELAKDLNNDGWEITISFLKRGKLPKIIAAEYPGFKTLPIGSSKGTQWSIIWNGNIVRTIHFLYLIIKNRYDICIAASSIPLALASRIMFTPIIQFYDDPERKKVNAINALLSDQLFFPPIVNTTSKISTFNCLKEWSYLSPNYYQPNLKVLEKFNLTPKEYIFIREVSNKSFNYFQQEDAIICSYAKNIDTPTKVILSLEDKSIKHKFPQHWTILEEPVEDIHSLIYFSKLVVSSGDSMAREGAMLGVPSVYCGYRDMKANTMLMELGLLQHLPGKSALTYINEVIKKPTEAFKQVDIRNQLMQNWCDMVEFMKEKIYQYKKFKK
jgi:uncharacterized protein